jgi:hypothetical protein
MLLIGCAEPPLASIRDIEPSLSSGGAYLPGEQQPLIEAGTPLANYLIHPEGAGQNLAQTFTPSENQWLGYLELPVGCEPGVFLNIKIRKGLEGTILYEANYGGLTGVPPGSFQLFQVFNPAVSKKGIKLAKAATYSFVLTAVLAPGATGVACSIAHGPAGDSYGGGVAYARELPAPWTPLHRPLGTDEDLPFITLVR